jgi:DNA-binding MarR family transcriptional regulator
MGLVNRIEDTVDRRLKQVSLTPAGGELVERLNRARMESARASLRLLSPGIRARLDEVLADLNAELAAQDPTIVLPGCLPAIRPEVTP